MKTKLSYTVRTTRALGETKDTVIPVITERLAPVELETVVENCIDRGLIAGLKPTAAHGIAEGVAAQIAREFSLGRGVLFGQYFYGRPYLSGTVDANGRLTGDNKVNVRLYKGADMLSFAWPAGLVAGRSYRMTVERTDVNGVTRTSLPKTVMVVAGATPPGPVPIAEKSDGTVKVYSVGGPEGGALKVGETWTVGGEGLFGSGDAPDGAWFVTGVAATVNDDACTATKTTREDGRTLDALVSDPGIYPGSYDNCELEISLAKMNGATDTVRVTGLTVEVEDGE